MKPADQIRAFFSGKNRPTLTIGDISAALGKLFSDFFNAYSKAYNKLYSRKGSLFMHTYKRQKVNDQKYLLNLVPYIHKNPIEAGLCSSLKSWKHSSFKSVLNKDSSFIKAEEVVEWFEDLENFVYVHERM